MSRSLVLHTGAGGYELFQEAMEQELGYYRIYIPKKLPRFVYRIGKPRVSLTGRKFWLKKKT